MKASAKELLADCGADAQDHPVVMDGTVARFKSNRVDRALADLVDLNQLWMRVDRENREDMLMMRRFYRGMGYSLCGYLDIFGDILDDEERKDKQRR